MSEIVDLALAEKCMKDALAIASDPAALDRVSVKEWEGRVEKFSATCAKVGYLTSIAVLGNAMLAKAANPRVDVFSLKAGADHPGAYDARRTAERVLVPASQQHEFHLGVTGPQPLNNSPFFRTLRIFSQMTVRKNAKPLLNDLLSLLQEIALMRTPEAVEALAGFIIVRRRYVERYDVAPPSIRVATYPQLAEAIGSFVHERSEGGGRAQAVAAGLLDVDFGPERVRLGKKNEPDRHVPGDIGLRAYAADDAPFERVLEIRDKPVKDYTVRPVAEKAASQGVPKVTLVAIASDQGPLDEVACKEAARVVGADLDIYQDWGALISSLSAWTGKTEVVWVERAAMCIRDRLEAIGLSAATVSEWDGLTGPAEA